MKWPSFSSIVRQVRLIWRLLWDKRVPFILKILVLAPLGYLLFPFDLVPDVLVVIGWLEDMVLLAIGLKLFVRFCPRAIVEEHLSEIDSVAAAYWVKEDEPPKEPQGYIDTPYRIRDDEPSEGGDT